MLFDLRKVEGQHRTHVVGPCFLDAMNIGTVHNWGIPKLIVSGVNIIIINFFLQMFCCSDAIPCHLMLKGRVAMASKAVLVERIKSLQRSDAGAKQAQRSMAQHGTAGYLEQLSGLVGLLKCGAPNRWCNGNIFTQHL